MDKDPSAYTVLGKGRENGPGKFSRIPSGKNGLARLPTPRFPYAYLPVRLSAPTSEFALSLYSF